MTRTMTVNEGWVQRDKHLNYLAEAQKELETESDRGIVLVCLSILDELLAELLQTKLLRDEKLMKDMFGTKGVFGQFDDKVKACYAMGLISQLDYDLFKKLQNVRNKFAHRVLDISFDEPAIQDVCRHIALPKNAYMPRNIETRKDVERPKLELNPIKSETSARNRFLYAFQFLFLELENRHLMQLNPTVIKPADYITFPIMLKHMEEEWAEQKKMREDVLRMIKEQLMVWENIENKTQRLLEITDNPEEQTRLREEAKKVEEEKKSLNKQMEDLCNGGEESERESETMRTIFSWLQAEIERSME